MKKILAIDDQRDNLTTIKALLRNYMPECEVLTAISGKEGIKTAEQEQPDTILLDIAMPEMDGYNVCIKLKANEATRNIPIVMLTAIKTDIESKIKGLEAGADAFFTKPIEPIELSAQINVMLRIKEAEDKLRSEKELLDDKVKERTKKLKKSEEKYRSLVETIEEGIGNVDEKENFTLVNQAAADIFGYTKKEMIGKNLKEFTPPEIFQQILKHTSIRKKGESSTYELSILRKNGEEKFITLTATPIYDKNRKYHGAFGIFHDITEHKKVEEELKKHRDHLEELVKERTKELEEKNKELKRFNKLFVGREFRIKELKDKVKELEKELERKKQ